MLMNSQELLYKSKHLFYCFHRFLRSGFIVGQAGIFNGILIIIATVSLVLISVLAAVGICERCRVESGGVYFLIAHTLGSRFGGSLGLLYCFGQAVGCALNVLGFGESMAGLVGFENNQWAIRAFAAGAVLLLGVINVAGVKWVIKLQFLLLLVLLCAGLNFMVGSFIGEDPSMSSQFPLKHCASIKWNFVNFRERFQWLECQQYKVEFLVALHRRVYMVSSIWYILSDNYWCLIRY